MPSGPPACRLRQKRPQFLDRERSLTRVILYVAIAESGNRVGRGEATGDVCLRGRGGPAAAGQPTEADGFAATQGAERSVAVPCGVPHYRDYLKRINHLSVARSDVHR
jgi:hypothetical protein